jgi:hypothetical protein
MTSNNSFSNMADTLNSNLTKMNVTECPRYLARWRSFRDIMRQAETNVTLDDALRQVETLYILINDNTEK